MILSKQFKSRETEKEKERGSEKEEEEEEEIGEWIKDDNLPVRVSEKEGQIHE